MKRTIFSLIIATCGSTCMFSAEVKPKVNDQEVTAEEIAAAKKEFEASPKTKGAMASNAKAEQALNDSRAKAKEAIDGAKKQIANAEAMKEEIKKSDLEFDNAKLAISEATKEIESQNKKKDSESHKKEDK